MGAKLTNQAAAGEGIEDHQLTSRGASQQEPTVGSETAASHTGRGEVGTERKGRGGGEERRRRGEEEGEERREMDIVI